MDDKVSRGETKSKNSARYRAKPQAQKADILKRMSEGRVDQQKAELRASRQRSASWALACSKAASAGRGHSWH